MSVVLIVLLACTACTAGASRRAWWRPAGKSSSARPSRSQSSAARPSRITQAWVSTGLRPVSSVDVVGSVALVYGRAHGGLYMYGLDARTGRTLWRSAASSSATTPGVALAPTDVHGSVVYFGPMHGRSDAARMIVADPATGRARVQSAPMSWQDTPTQCGDSDPAPCAPAEDDTGQSADYRLDPRSGRLKIYDSGYRVLGDGGLVDPGLRDPEYIEFRDRRGAYGTGWDIPLNELFARGYSTDNGWDFRKFGDNYVGTLRRQLRGAIKGDTFTVDLAHDLLTSGFAVVTGDVRWQRHGTSIDCEGTLEPPDGVPVRCRYTGSISYHVPAHGKGQMRVTTSGLSVTVEGFDPADGSTTWSHRLGALTSLVDDSNRSIIASEREALIRTPGRPTILNLANGAARPVPAGETFWCSYTQSFTQTPQLGVEKVGDLTRICDANGKPTTKLPDSVPALVSAQGPGGLRLVSTAAAVVAYRG